MDRELAKRTLLRILVAIAVTLGATAFMFGFFPGVEVYRRDVFIETRAVIENWNWFLGLLVILLAPGLLVWRTPLISYALLWSIWTIVVAVLAFIASFDLGDWGIRTVALWPHAVFGVLMFSLLLLLIAVVPVACGVFAWVTRDRVIPQPELPVARVIKTRA
jgi:hypothetical protein